MVLVWFSKHLKPLPQSVLLSTPPPQMWYLVVTVTLSTVMRVFLMPRTNGICTPPPNELQKKWCVFSSPFSLSLSLPLFLSRFSLPLFSYSISLPFSHFLLHSTYPSLVPPLYTDPWCQLPIIPDHCSSTSGYIWRGRNPPLPAYCESSRTRCDAIHSRWPRIEGGVGSY